jgi:putative copper export protein
MQAEPLLTWSEPVKEFISFVALFLSAGGIGFRFSVLRGRLITTDRPFYEDAARRAAQIGLVGVIVSLGMLLIELPHNAASRHLGVWSFVMSDPLTFMQLAFRLLALVGYVIAAARIDAGWILAAIGVIAGSLRAAFLGQWARLVNPVHMLAAGLWIGTLFVLVTAGLSALARHEHGRTRRAQIAADMVNGFSPLALTMGLVVVCFGVITAWRHLHVLSNLWSTPYGYMLIAKLVLVAGVFSLGAWNWRRQRPTLGSEEAAAAIQRSATSELLVALCVLVATAILVSLPSPKA